VETNYTAKEAHMADRTGVITMKGHPLTLSGQEAKVGDPAPDFEVLANDLSPFKLSSLKGKVAIICSVPSLDTPTCDIETRWFNEEAAKLGPGVEILTISMDLPFAQKRWCGAAGVERVTTYSDHRDAAFGQAYGVLIKELRLLARAVFVVDGAGTLRYMQLVKELANEPNYDEVLKVVGQLT
jgi:thioredoxin-dependent peroxiredoxin